MTNDEKTKFITDILEATKESLLARVNRMPDEWDGRELRQLIADDVSQNINNPTLKQYSSKRYKEYRNTCIVDNI
jgi:hypothetical protein